MKKFSMLAALVAAMVSMFAVVGSAQASTWQAAPAGGAFTASSGVSTTLKVQGKTTTCSTPTASGNVTGSGGGVFTGPDFLSDFTGAATVTPAFTGCTNAGVNYTVRCGSASLDADGGGYNGGTTTTEAASAGRSTNGHLTGILCTIKPTATPSNNCTTVTGSVPGVYTNPSTLAAGTGAANKGSLVVNTSGQSLNAASVGGCIASIGTGSATFSNTTYTVSGSPAATVAAPHLWAN